MKSLAWITLVILIILSASLGIGAAKPRIGATYDLTGTWAMVANTDFNFNVDIQQENLPDGNHIYGIMIRTNGQEPIDSIKGTIFPDGTVKFTRERPNEWIQTYSGGVYLSTGGLLMQGTFTQTGEPGKYPWSARQIDTRSFEEKLEDNFNNADEKSSQQLEILINIVKLLNEQRGNTIRM